MSVINDSISALLDVDAGLIDRTVIELQRVRAEKRQVFCFGNGGGAAHAMHFAADLRKIARVKAHSFDSIPEMTARINDQSWELAWLAWMTQWEWAGGRDMLFVFSCGGGNDAVSKNLPIAQHGIVGQTGADYDRIVIPSTHTPVIEGCQAVIAHDIIERLVS